MQASDVGSRVVCPPQDASYVLQRDGPLLLLFSFIVVVWERNVEEPRVESESLAHAW